MKIVGQVIKQKNSFVYVQAARPQSCEHCANSEICNKNQVEICAYNDIGATMGDFVTVETNEDKHAPLILAYLFLTPVAILFFSYFLYTLFPYLAFLALPLLAGYYLLLRRINDKHPVRARVVSPALPPNDCAELIAEKRSKTDV